MKTNKQLKQWIEDHCSSEDELDRTEYERYTANDYPEIQAENDEAILWGI